MKKRIISVAAATKLILLLVFIYYERIFSIICRALLIAYSFQHQDNLLQYENLKKKAQAAADTFNQHSTEIEATEKRMAEIAVLKKHIINYAKTRNLLTCDFFSSQSERSYTIFSENWGYSLTSIYARNPTREFCAKSQGVPPCPACHYSFFKFNRYIKHQFIKIYPSLDSFF
ncbi:hypothetical protein [Lacrimispora sp.]|uniref:hypothetical protein n=1 Tax=Lacrimispora sp. TaxID=2719234 RepID=UPI002FDB139A